MKTIELTNEQYKQMVKLAFIGEWILNAQGVKPKFPEEQQNLNYLFSFCKTFGLSHRFNQFHDEWELKQEQVLNILSLVDEFSLNSFWETLIEKLSERDVIESLTVKENVSKLDFEDLLEQRAMFYLDEFTNNGLLNLRLTLHDKLSDN